LKLHLEKHKTRLRGLVESAQADFGLWQPRMHSLG
jgi:hypothetical protein